MTRRKTLPVIYRTLEDAQTVCQVFTSAGIEAYPVPGKTYPQYRVCIYYQDHTVNRKGGR